jgi:4-amino-4-deoxy-L-arabinose transferase-like glycosyltransferase
MPRDTRREGGRLISRRAAAAVAIALIALALRLPGLDRWPPAIHQDEASNVVDGWSLLTDGVDRAGRAWPVFLEGFGAGDNRTSLYAILTIPCVAVFGPGAFASRLPAAILGVWTVLALYLLTRRVRGDAAALWAAGLLAANPWHVYLSRFGHEASITPAFLITALWLLAGREGIARRGKESTLRWTVAGLLLAVGLYSYPSFRLFLPLILVLAWVFKAGPRLSRGSFALPAALALGALPLLFASLAHPDRLLGRASAASVLGNVQPLGFALWVIVRQYARHFLPGFLFVSGDANPLQSPPGGELLWAELPGLLLGLIIMARRRDRWDRFSLIWLLLYPVASAVTLGDRPEYVPHSLRAAVGLPLFQFIGGDAIATTLRSISRRRGGATEGSSLDAIGGGTTREADHPTPRAWRSVRAIAVAAGAAWAIAIAVNVAVVAVQFTGSYARAAAPLYHAAYPPAVRYLAANRERYSTLVISGRSVQQAYIYTILYGLQTPTEFREAPKEISQTDWFHLVHRVGGTYYFYSQEDLTEIISAVHGRIWALVVPGEIRGGRVVASFPYPGGEPGLEVREIDL